MTNWAAKQSSGDGRRGTKTQEICVVAFAFALSIGTLDVTISVWQKPLTLSSFPLTLAFLAVVTFVFFLLYAFLWVLVGTQLERRFKLRGTPLAVSLAVFLGMVVALVSSSDANQFSPFPDDLGDVFIFFCLSLLASITTYQTTKTLAHRSQFRNAARATCLATPFVLLELLLLVWILKYGIENSLSFLSVAALLLFVVIGSCTALICSRVARKTRVDNVLPAFMLFLLLAPSIYWAVPNAHGAPEGLMQDNHAIKHVILITVDTLRADVLFAYGAAGVSTPNIDQLTEDGVLFQNAISAAPWTLPAVTSIMTGLSPMVHGAVRLNSRLSDSVPTLAEYLRADGYFTAAIGNNPVLTTDFNLSQGFLEYNFFPKLIGGSFGARLFYWLAPALFSPSTESLTDSALSWLDSNHEKDFLLWIHYFDPHVPYTPPPEYLPETNPPSTMGTYFIDTRRIRDGEFVPSPAEERWIEQLYEGEVRYLDKNVGDLLAALKRLDLYADSLIILTSDHGEEFWEHGGYEHGHTLYNEILQVPLIIKLPSFAAAKKKISTPVPTQAIMPTILDLCGIEYQTNHLSVGSLLPLWGQSPATLEERPIISTGLLYNENQESVIFGRLKYIRSLLTNREELYDLVRDPGEETSVAALFSDEIEKARILLREHHKIANELAERYGTNDGGQIKIDEGTRQLLKSVGYIQ